VHIIQAFVSVKVISNCGIAGRTLA